MAERQAAILLPVMRPEDLEVTLVLEPAPAAGLDVLVNGQYPESISRDADGSVVVRMPSRLLFRGDNQVAMMTPRFEGVRLHEIRYRPLRANPES
jgi:hypothetical protein